MRAIDLILEVSRFAPGIDLKSSMLKKLKIIKPEASVPRYLGAALILSLFFGFISAMLALFLNESIAYSLLGFSLSFAFFLALPSFELKRRSAEFEAKLPLTLRTVGMLLDMNIPFIRALKIVSSTEPEFQDVIREIDRGITPQKSLSQLALSYDSVPVKRAISQLITSYEIGSSGKEIRKIGDEMLASQRHALREYASKSAIFGLLFIVSSAVMPTFFLVYSVLGQYTIGAAIEKIAMALAMLVVFPLISLSILLMAKSSLPRSALESSTKAQDLAVLGPTAFLVLALLILPQELAIFGILIGCLGAGYIIYQRFLEEKSLEEIEKHLPDAMFAVSSLPKSTKLEDVFRVIEKSDYQSLSLEAKKSRTQLETNLSTDLVLEDLASRNNSGMLSRACSALKYVFSTNSFASLNNLAEDMLQFVEIKRERAGLLAMQKYTLVFGGLIVPLILRITLNLLNSMAEFFSDAGAAPQLDFAFSLIPAYLVIYALLSSIYISNIDERKSAGAGYFLGIVIVSLATFFLLNI